jgi:hypothetical protein
MLPRGMTVMGGSQTRGFDGGAPGAQTFADDIRPPVQGRIALCAAAAGALTWPGE